MLFTSLFAVGCSLVWG